MGGKEREFGMDMYTVPYLKWITNKDLLLYNTGSSAQCYVTAWVGGKFEGEWIHVNVWLSPFVVHLKLPQHCSLAISSVQFSHSVVSDSLRPHGLQPTRVLRPWDFPSKSAGLGCHCLLRWRLVNINQIPNINDIF